MRPPIKYSMALHSYRRIIIPGILVNMQRAIQKFDASVTLRIQEFPPSWRTHFRHMTLIGQPVFALAVAGGVALYAESAGLWQLLLAAIISGITALFASALKFVLRRKRPATPYAAAMRLKTYSFPSGHAAATIACYGLVAYLCLAAGGILLTAVGIGVSLMIISIGASRVYLGAHFPTDILGGWILGGLGLMIAISTLYL